jgi:hypothetical protein
MESRIAFVQISFRKEIEAGGVLCTIDMGLWLLQPF